MIKIWLTGNNGRGLYAMIDDEDVTRITEYAWHLHKYGYAAATIDGKHVMMHAFVYNGMPCKHVDHKNRNRLDNQKDNLRPSTFSENLSNSSPRFGRKYKGVYEEMHKKLGTKRFHAYATKDHKMHSFGRYHTAEQAAYAYDIGIKKLRGEFAYLNFPNE